MLTVGAGPGSFHARADLPDDPGDVDGLVETLLRPARKHRVEAVVFVVYSEDSSVADETTWSLNETFDEAGIDVIEVLRVHGGHWFAILPGLPPAAYRGVPFDVSSHPFTAQGVLNGRVTHGSRDELRATLAPDPAAVARTSRLLAGAATVPEGGLRTLVEAHLAYRTVFSPEELASVAYTHVAAPAAVLAFAAWLTGDGALAWCAIDRCRDVVANHSLANLVAVPLESATSPPGWSTLQPEPDGAADPAA